MGVSGKSLDAAEPGRPAGPKGCGEFDPRTGLYEWYEDGPTLDRDRESVGWPEVLALWALIEADFGSEYGIDLTPEVMRARSWRWFRTRVTGLLAADTRLRRVLFPDPESEH